MKRLGAFLPKAKQPQTLQPPCRQVYARVQWQYMRVITETEKGHSQIFSDVPHAI